MEKQPPSGGCVLKLFSFVRKSKLFFAAAFARLCVETGRCKSNGRSETAAAFARLCVETATCEPKRVQIKQPPSRGCVLKRNE